MRIQRLQRLRHYLPAFLSFGFGVLVLLVPTIAVVIVFGASTLFAVFYATIVKSIHRAKDHMESQSAMGNYQWSSVDPSFRNVSVRVFQRGGIIRDV